MPRRTLTLLLAALVAGTAAAQAPAPGPPDLYHVRIRYEIKAGGLERITAYEDMLTALKKAGFNRDPNEPLDENEREDPKADRMSGTVKPADVPRLFNDPHVASVQLIPEKEKLPDDKDARVRVR